MRIAAAFLILIGIVLLVFGLISLDAHAPPETKMVAPFMIARRTGLPDHRHRNSREHTSRGVML